MGGIVKGKKHFCVCEKAERCRNADKPNICHPEVFDPYLRCFELMPNIRHPYSTYAEQMRRGKLK